MNWPILGSHRLKTTRENKDGKHHCFANKALIKCVNKNPFTATALSPFEGRFPNYFSHLHKTNINLKPLTNRGLDTDSHTRNPFRFDALVMI